MVFRNGILYYRIGKSNFIMETWILIDDSGEFHWKKIEKTNFVVYFYFIYET